LDALRRPRCRGLLRHGQTGASAADRAGTPVLVTSDALTGARMGPGPRRHAARVAQRERAGQGETHREETHFAFARERSDPGYGGGRPGNGSSSSDRPRWDRMTAAPRCEPPNNDP